MGDGVPVLYCVLVVHDNSERGLFEFLEFRFCGDTSTRSHILNKDPYENKFRPQTADNKVYYVFLCCSHTTYLTGIENGKYIHTRLPDYISSFIYTIYMNRYKSSKRNIT